MCIGIAIPKGATLPSREELLRCFNANRHGAGFCYATGEDGKVHAHKGLMTFEDFYKTLIDKFPIGAAGLIHFRLGTSGKKSADGSHHPECTHPFPVTNHYASLFLLDYSFEGPCLIHNGVITGYGHGDMSDTQEFVERYSSGQATLASAGNHNKIAVLNPDCSIEYHSTLWLDDAGRRYTNSGYKAYVPYAGTGGTRSYYGSVYDDDYDWPRKTPLGGCGGSSCAPVVRRLASVWTDKAAGDLGLFMLEDNEWVELADGTYNTVLAVSQMYDYASTSTYAAQYRSVFLASDLQGCVWMLMNYKNPIPCGRMTSLKEKRDRRGIDKAIREQDKALLKEINQGVTVGEVAGKGLPAPLPARLPPPPLPAYQAPGKINTAYIPPGGAAAWRGFKVGDRVMIDDRLCVAKDGKAGVIEELPDYTSATTGPVGSVNNRCRVKIDNAGGQYVTTKPSDLKLLSSQSTGLSVSTVEVSTEPPVSTVPASEAPVAPVGVEGYVHPGAI